MILYYNLLSDPIFKLDSPLYHLVLLDLENELQRSKSCLLLITSCSENVKCRARGLPVCWLCLVAGHPCHKSNQKEMLFPCPIFQTVLQWNKGFKLISWFQKNEPLRIHNSGPLVCLLYVFTLRIHKES